MWCIESHEIVGNNTEILCTSLKVTLCKTMAHTIRILALTQSTHLRLIFPVLFCMRMHTRASVFSSMQFYHVHGFMCPSPRQRYRAVPLPKRSPLLSFHSQLPPSPPSLQDTSLIFVITVIKITMWFKQWFTSIYPGKSNKCCLHV